MDKNSIVLKIGGSLLYHENLDLNMPFLNKFLIWFEKARQRYKSIVIIVGGGKMSRHLVNQIGSFEIAVENKHRIGMAVTDCNAEVLRTIVNDKKVKVPKSLGQVLELIIDDTEQILIMGGFKEGWSTDMDAAVLAHVMGLKKIYKLSNIDHIYTADPSKDPGARPIMELTWSDYFSQFGIVPGVSEHQPNLSVPIDVLCAQFCANKGITYMLSGGVNIDKENDLQNVLESGTIVHP